MAVHGRHRELQVLGLLGAGKSNQQIADELVVVVDTVKKHVGHILDKLGGGLPGPSGRPRPGAGPAALGVPPPSRDGPTE